MSSGTAAGGEAARLFAVPAPAREPAPGPGERPAAPPELTEALDRLRHEVQRLSLPMETPGAPAMRTERERVLRLLDDYLGRRMDRRDGPVLVVIGGPTGAGKSTLINSLVGAQVSPSGVLRPTTAEPVLVYNPADGPAFFRRRLLPNLTATTASGRDPIGPESERGAEATAMRLVPSEDIAPGLALVDSPDFDSYRIANHHLAADLLDIADIWLYVTTGTDYAGAVPWDFLRVAAGRKLGVAAVLNRMRHDEIPVVGPDLARLLDEQQLGETPMFVVPEVTLVDRRIPVRYVEPLVQWLSEQAGGSGRDYVGRAMSGTVSQVLESIGRLSEAAADQVVADRRLRVDLRAAFRAARGDIDEAVAGGTLDLAPVREAWAAAVGELARARRSDRLWRRLGAPRVPATDAQRAPAEAVVTLLTTLTSRVAQRAVTRVAERWAVHPAARSIGLDRILELPVTFEERAAEAAWAWLDEVAGVTPDPGDNASALVAAVRTATLALHPAPGDASDPDGPLEPYAPTQPAGPSPEELDRLRADLVDRLGAVCGEEEARLGALLDGVSTSSALALRDAGQALSAAWAAADPR